MKKLIFAGMLATAGLAGAQTFSGDNGDYKLLGCFHMSKGVQCDFTYSPKKDNRLYWRTDLYQIVTSDGGNLRPSYVSAGGGNLTSGWTETLNVYRGTPIKTSAIFDLPATTRNIRILTVEQGRADNVPIRNAAPVAAPVETPTQVVNIAGNWKAELKECRQVPSGEVLCIAVLSK